MTRHIAWLGMALALWPLSAMAASGRAVVLDNAGELRQGYCEGTVSGSAGGMTTLAIEDCQDGGIAGVAPGSTHAFPDAAVLDAEQGLAMAKARKQFFASPQVAAILRGGYMPASGEDFTPLATLAGQGGLDDWKAFIGMLQPVATLGGVVHAKRITAYTADDFSHATDAYANYATREKAAIGAYAAAVARLQVTGTRRGLGLGAALLVQTAMSGYNLPFAPAMPDDWLRLQLLAARTGSAMLAAYREAMTPLGLPPFFISEIRSLERSDAQIRAAAQRTYAKAADQAALAVLTDAEYAKTDTGILADVTHALSAYSEGRPAALAAAKAQIAHDRRIIAITDRIMAAMKGHYWRMTIAEDEDDADKARHLEMMFVRTSARTIEARTYERGQQASGKPAYVWPVYVQDNGDARVNSAVSGFDNPFVIPAKAFATGRFRVRSEGFSEVFTSSGELSPVAAGG